MTNRDKLVAEFFELYEKRFGVSPLFKWIDFKSDNDIKMMVDELKENLEC